MDPRPPRLTAIPLAAWERDGVMAALRKANLPADDVALPDRHFWRFETLNPTPVGFGGLEIHGHDALLRSVVTLPPLRRRGFGKAMVAALEDEARIAGCRAIFLVPASFAAVFERLGYTVCAPETVPQAIRDTSEFATRGAANLMTKPLP